MPEAKPALSESRLRWLLTAPFETKRARLRAVWHFWVRRYPYEICMTCGRPVGPHTGSWWKADTELWFAVNGGYDGVLCPPCFTAGADAIGEPVHWEAVRGV
jgi:hypothetical protein